MTYNPISYRDRYMGGVTQGLGLREVDRRDQYQQELADLMGYDIDRDGFRRGLRNTASKMLGMLGGLPGIGQHVPQIEPAQAPPAIPQGIDPKMLQQAALTARMRTEMSRPGMLGPLGEDPLLQSSQALQALAAEPAVAMETLDSMYQIFSGLREGNIDEQTAFRLLGRMNDTQKAAIGPIIQQYVGDGDISDEDVDKILGTLEVMYQDEFSPNFDRRKSIGGQVSKTSREEDQQPAILRMGKDTIPVMYRTDPDTGEGMMLWSGEWVPTKGYDVAPVVKSGGQEGDVLGIDKVLSRGLQEEIMSIDQFLTDLDETSKNVPKLFFENQFRGKVGIDQWAENWGLDVDSQQEWEDLQDQYFDLRRRSMAFQNDIIRLQTGAAMSIQEAERIMKELPDFTNSSYQEYVRALDGVRRDLRFVRARKYFYNKNGIEITEKDNGGYDLNPRGMAALINTYISSEYADQDPAQAFASAIKDLGLTNEDADIIFEG